ncbi:hypothetical protein OG21DRAFT_1488418 [Imleria badia]|nr:hypothetical protein OG21DRAFT_1488418 [Imleria badia]
MSHTCQNNFLYKSHLDYLDLCQEPNMRVEIKMATSFDFERLDESLCILPAANLSIMFSHGIDNALERASVQCINDIFVTEYLPALRKHLFSWSSVELLSSMKETPLPTVSDDEKGNQVSPISISSDSSPGTPTKNITAFTSPTIPKQQCYPKKAPVFVLAKKKVPAGSFTVNDADIVARALPGPVPEPTVPAATPTKNSRMAKRKPIQSTAMDNVELAIEHSPSIPCNKQTQPNTLELPTSVPNISISHQTPTKPCKLVAQAQN